MSSSHTYTVPAYYPEFRCKAGDCRHPCCTGWDIAISMNEYFRMLGMNCSPELRRRLDTAFHLADDPSEYHYAVISPRWDGDCPLHLPNGYCGLQCECGEDAIPSVCRYYPRSPKTRYAYQCQCSNSCEAVVELLFSMQEPMTFLRRPLSFHMVEHVPHENDPVARLFPAIQKACLHILQDRTRPFSLRLQHLGELTMVLDVPYHRENADGMRILLPFAATATHADHIEKEQQHGSRELLSSLTYLRDYLCHLEVSQEKIARESASARALLGMPAEGPLPTEVATRWVSYRQQFDRFFPDNERQMEQLFVNHLCYDCYPFSPDHKTLWDSFLSFCTAYALVLLFSVCHLTEIGHADNAAYADIVAAVFRMVEHTAFTHNTAILTRRFHFYLPEQIMLLTKL